MSRSNKTEWTKNPAEYDIEFKGGKFVYYDKEQKTNIELDGLKFAVLDELSTIRGWSDSYDTGIFGNEVQFVGNQPLEVKVWTNGKVKEIIAGLYKDIKGDIITMGGKYHKVIYAVILDANPLSYGTVVKILLRGAALSSWVNKEFKADEGAINWDGCEDGKKGSVKYKIPLFSSGDIEETDEDLATKADERLQEWIGDQKAHRDSNKVAETPDTPPAETPDVPPDTDDENIPF